MRLRSGKKALRALEKGVVTNIGNFLSLDVPLVPNEKHSRYIRYPDSDTWSTFTLARQTSSSYFAVDDCGFD